MLSAFAAESGDEHDVIRVENDRAHSDHEQIQRPAHYRALQFALAELHRAQQQAQENRRKQPYIRRRPVLQTAQQRRRFRPGASAVEEAVRRRNARRHCRRIRLRKQRDNFPAKVNRRAHDERRHQDQRAQRAKTRGPPQPSLSGLQRARRRIERFAAARQQQRERQRAQRRKRQQHPAGRQPGSNERIPRTRTRSRDGKRDHRSFFALGINPLGHFLAQRHIAIAAALAAGFQHVLGLRFFREIFLVAHERIAGFHTEKRRLKPEGGQRQQRRRKQRGNKAHNQRETSVRHYRSSSPRMVSIM